MDHRHGAPPALSRAVRLLLRHHLLAQWPWLVLLSALGPFVTAIAIAHFVDRTLLFGWLGFCLLSAALGAAIAWRRVWFRNEWWLVAAAGFHGLEAGLMQPLFVQHNEPRLIALLPAATCVLGGISVIALHADRRAMTAILLGLFLPGSMWALADSAPPGSLMLVTWPLAFTILGVWGWQAHTALRRSIQLACENRRLRRESDQRRAAAERDDQSKSRFLAIASHDLRQPLQGLLLQVEALRLQTDAHASFASLVERIVRSSGALAKLLNSLLDLSRLDLRRVKPEFSAIDLESLLADLGAAYAPRAAQAGLRFRSRLGKRCAIESDGLLLRRLLDNLLDNAFRYTARGGVLLAVRRQGREVWIEVRDTGCGVPEREQPLIFEEFYRTRNETFHVEPGLGLGLAVAKRLAHLLKGRLRLVSTPGRGSMFRLHLRAAPQHNAVVNDCESVRPQRKVSDSTWIMLIERNDERREALEPLLRHWGFHVLSAASTTLALKLSEGTTQVPALLLVGHATCIESASALIGGVEALRDEYNTAMPCVVLSAGTDPSAARDFALSDCRLAALPVETERLRALLDEVLARSPINDANVQATSSTASQAVARA